MNGGVMKYKKYLNEEKYQKASNKLFAIGVGLIVFGAIIAVIMIVSKLNIGTNEGELKQQLSELKIDLEQRYDELEGKGIKESWDYKDREGYQMTLIDIALDPTYDTCERSPLYSDNDVTREYCEVKAKLYDMNEGGSILPIIVPALMVLMPCVGFGAMLIIISKRREITAFTAQQIMPVAKEGIEEMAPTIGNVAKEISKGIKEGKKE